MPSPFIFEAGACSKHSQNKPSPGFMGLIVEDGKLESSTLSLSSFSNGASASVFPVSSVLASLPPRRMAMAPMVTLGSISSISALEVLGGSGSSVQVSPSWLTQPPTLPILTTKVVQATCELGSSPLAPISLSLEPAETKVLTSGDPIEKLVEKSSSPIATKDKDDELLGTEVRATVHEASDCKVVFNSYPTIRELVSDLDKSWGNSKEWMLQLRDGQQIVIPLSLNRSPKSASDCLVTDLETITGNDSFINDGQMINWVEDCDGLVDSLSILNEVDEEMWDFDESSMTLECSGKPLVVAPLATEDPLELECSSELGVRCKESIDGNNLSQWVTNRIKALRKSVGTSLEGFEEQITGLLLAIKAKKNNKKLKAVDDQMKHGKSRQKGQRELKNLLTSMNVEVGSSKSRNASKERAVVVLSMNLKIISWNVRGLNDRDKRLWVRNMVRRWGLDVIYL